MLLKGAQFNKLKQRAKNLGAIDLNHSTRKNKKYVVTLSNKNTIDILSILDIKIIYLIKIV